MKAEKWLNRVKCANDKVERLKYERMRALESACGAVIDTSNERVQTSIGNTAERKFIAYADYAELINCAIDEFADIRAEVEKAINCVEGYTYRELLRMRYLEFRTWKYIARKLGMNENTVRGVTRIMALKAVEAYCI